MSWLKNLITLKKTFLMSKAGCPYCIRAIEIMKDSKKEYTVFDYVKDKELDKEISRENKYYTYPKVYVDGNFIGGCSELEKVKKEL